MFGSGHKDSPGILQNPAEKLKHDINFGINDNNNKRASASPKTKSMLPATTGSLTKKAHNGDISPLSINSDETDTEFDSAYSLNDFSGVSYKSEENEEELVEEHAPVDEAHINDDDTTHDEPLLNADKNAGTLFNSPSSKEEHAEKSQHNVETNTLDTSKKKTDRRLNDSPAGKQTSPAQKSTSEKGEKINADASEKRNSPINGKDDTNPPTPEPKTAGKTANKRPALPTNSEPTEEPAPTPEPLSSQKSEQGKPPTQETKTKPPIETKPGNFLIVNSQTYKNLAEVLEEILLALCKYEKFQSQTDELDTAPEDQEEFLAHEDVKIIEQNAKSDPPVVTPAPSPRTNELTGGNGKQPITKTNMPSKGNRKQVKAKAKTPPPVKCKLAAKKAAASVSANASVSFVRNAPNETVASEWADLMSTVRRMALDPEKSESTANIIKEILDSLPKDQNLDRFFDEPLAILQASQNQKVGDIIKSIKETQNPQESSMQPKQQPSMQQQQQQQLSTQQLQQPPIMQQLQLLPVQHVQLKPRTPAIHNSQENKLSTSMFTELKNRIETVEEKQRQKTSNPWSTVV